MLIFNSQNRTEASIIKERFIMFPHKKPPNLETRKFLGVRVDSIVELTVNTSNVVKILRNKILNKNDTSNKRYALFFFNTLGTSISIDRLQ